jgi:shikimate dehydrogenase
MYPSVEQSPWHNAEVFHEGQLVYDLIYNPSETRLMADARARGANVMGGLQMLIEQAALSYQMWTGRPMDRDATKEILNR